jgi:hypothetical protein
VSRLTFCFLTNRNVDILGFPGVEVRSAGSYIDSLSSTLSDMSSVLSSNMTISTTTSLRSDPGTLVLRTQVFSTNARKVADKNSGHLHAIFAKTCSDIKNLIRDQVIAVEHAKEKLRVSLLRGAIRCAI